MKLNLDSISTGPMAALTADHMDMEERFLRVLGSFRGGEPDLIRAEWLALERQLGTHMRAEEESILPLFERAFPHEAAHIRNEHHDIRRRLEQLGVELDLHALRAATAAEFITVLRDHARREESAFYTWAERDLPEPQVRSVLERLRNRTLRVGARASSEQSS